MLKQVCEGLSGGKGMQRVQWWNRSEGYFFSSGTGVQVQWLKKGTVVQR